MGENGWTGNSDGKNAHTYLSSTDADRSSRRLAHKCHENFCVLTIWELDREGRQGPPEQKDAKMWQNHMHV